MHTTTPPKILSSTSGNFYLPILPLLFNKIILTIPTNIPFLYAAAIFHLTVSAYNHPGYLHQPYFPYLIYLANSDCVKGQRSYGVLISSFFPKVWTAVWFLITQAWKIDVLQVVVSDEDACNWNSKLFHPLFLIPSIYSHYFHTLVIPSSLEIVSF